MDINVYNYREKHKKCKYCKYFRHVEPCVPCCSGYYECKAKEKVIYFDSIPRLCSCYEVRNDEPYYEDWDDIECFHN